MAIPSNLTIGTIVKNYRVLRLIREGGMGAVYEVEHCELKRKAALKVLLLPGSTPELEQRFKNEALLASGIAHQYIVDIFDYDVLPDGGRFLLMEYLDGEPLDVRIDAIKRGEVRALHNPQVILYQLATALAVLHERTIIHRDLKPGNVMIMPPSESDGTEQVKILDFGIAKRLVATLPQAQLTRAGVPMGTPAYMAPEQLSSAADATFQADVYSLGVIAYELYTGRQPFVRPMARLLGPAPPLQAPAAPPKIARMIQAMLELDPLKRPSVLEVAKAFGDWGGRTPKPARSDAWQPGTSYAISAIGLPSSGRAIFFGGLGGFAVAALVLLIVLVAATVSNSTPVIRLGMPPVDASPRVLGTSADMAPQADLAPVMPITPPDLGHADMARPRERTPAPSPCVYPTAACFRGDLTPEQKELMAKTAQRAGLRMCRGKSLTLTRMPKSFFVCPILESDQSGLSVVCESFVTSLDAKWDTASWRTPELVEIKCPSN